MEDKNKDFTSCDTKDAGKKATDAESENVDEIASFAIQNDSPDEVLQSEKMEDTKNEEEEEQLKSDLLSESPKDLINVNEHSPNGNNETAHTKQHSPKEDKQKVLEPGEQNRKDEKEEEEENSSKEEPMEEPQEVKLDDNEKPASDMANGHENVDTEKNPVKVFSELSGGLKTEGDCNDGMEISGSDPCSEDCKSIVISKRERQSSDEEENSLNCQSKRLRKSDDTTVTSDVLPPAMLEDKETEAQKQVATKETPDDGIEVLLMQENYRSDFSSTIGFAADLLGVDSKSDEEDIYLLGYNDIGNPDILYCRNDPLQQNIETDDEDKSSEEDKKEPVELLEKQAAALSEQPDRTVRVESLEESHTSASMESEGPETGAASSPSKTDVEDGERMLIVETDGSGDTNDGQAAELVEKSQDANGECNDDETIKATLSDSEQLNENCHEDNKANETLCTQNEEAPSQGVEGKRLVSLKISRGEIWTCLQNAGFKLGNQEKAIDIVERDPVLMSKLMSMPSKDSTEGKDTTADQNEHGEENVIQLDEEECDILKQLTDLIHNRIAEDNANVMDMDAADAKGEDVGSQQDDDAGNNDELNCEKLPPAESPELAQQLEQYSSYLDALSTQSPVVEEISIETVRTTRESDNKSGPSAKRVKRKRHRSSSRHGKHSRHAKRRRYEEEHEYNDNANKNSGELTENQPDNAQTVQHTANNDNIDDDALDTSAASDNETDNTNAAATNAAECGRHIKLFLSPDETTLREMREAALTIGSGFGLAAGLSLEEYAKLTAAAEKRTSHSNRRMSLSALSSTKSKQMQMSAKDDHFKKPFDYGWKRELVWRSNMDSTSKADVYFIAPNGKKYRSRTDIIPHLVGDLTIDHFCFIREPQGVGPEYELVRNAKSANRTTVAPPTTSSAGSNNDSSLVLTGKRIVKPKAPKGASPPPEGWTAVRALRSNNAALTSKLQYGGYYERGSMQHTGRGQQAAQAEPKTSTSTAATAAAAAAATSVALLPPTDDQLPSTSNGTQSGEHAHAHTSHLVPAAAPAAAAAAAGRANTRQMLAPQDSSLLCDCTCLLGKGMLPSLKCETCQRRFHGACIGVRHSNIKLFRRYACGDPELLTCDGKPFFCRMCNLNFDSNAGASTQPTGVQVGVSSLTPTQKIVVVGGKKYIMNGRSPKPQPKPCIPLSGKPLLDLHRYHKMVHSKKKVINARDGAEEYDSDMDAGEEEMEEKYDEEGGEYDDEDEVEENDEDRVEADRVEADDEDRVEADRVEADDEDKVEADRVEADEDRVEADRVEADDEDRVEADDEDRVVEENEEVGEEEEDENAEDEGENENAEDEEVKNAGGEVETGEEEEETDEDESEAGEDEAETGEDESEAGEDEVEAGGDRVETEEASTEDDTEKTKFMSSISSGYNIMLHVMKHLPLQDLLRAGATCKLFQAAARDARTWQCIKTNSQTHIKDWQRFFETLRRMRTQALVLEELPMEDTSKNSWYCIKHEIGETMTLRKLELPQCPAFVLEDVIETNTTLIELKAQATTGTSISVKKLGLVTHLSKFYVRSLEKAVLEGDFNDIRPNRLKHLSLRNFGNLDDKSWPSLRKFIHLRTLELGDCTQIDSHKFSEALLKLQKLTRLRIELGPERRSESKFCVLQLLESVRKLKQLKQLEIINFDMKCGFDDIISKCKNLKSLMLLPTYVSQAATTNQNIMNGIFGLEDTLKHFSWVFTIELLRVTALYASKEEDCLPVLRPVPGDLNDSTEEYTITHDANEDADGEQQHVAIVTLNRVQEIMQNRMQSTQLKFLKVMREDTMKLRL